VRPAPAVHRRLHGGGDQHYLRDDASPATGIFVVSASRSHRALTRTVASSQTALKMFLSMARLLGLKLQARCWTTAFSNAEGIVKDSRLQFGSANLIQADAFKGKPLSLEWPNEPTYCENGKSVANDPKLTMLIQGNRSGLGVAGIANLLNCAYRLNVHGWNPS
jgi:hypothetical protein